MLTPRTTERHLETPPPTFDVPDVIADHTLLRCIGEGSYGRVYLAQNQLTGVYRALKIVFRGAFRDSRPYLREFDAICRFEPVSRSHAGFVQILHVGKLENAFYYIMELADDALTGPIGTPEAYIPRTLALNRGETLPIERCVEIGSNLADCLAVLHEHNLIHRDIKPSNIIFVNGKPKLADIGLVTQIDEAKSFVGTAGFMPPEGPTTPASDVYSLGKVLYEIATGKDRCEFPQLPSDITAENALDLELNQIVLRACHPDPTKRYASAREFRHELELLQAGRSIKRLRQVERRLRFVKMAFATSALFAIAAFAIYYQVKSSREQAERERQRQAGYLLAEGTSQMRKGYLTHALPYFIRAAEYDPSDLRSHRLRIGSVFAHAPHLVLRWKCPREGQFSPDGIWLVAPQENALIIYESVSGRAIKTNILEKPPGFAKFSVDRTRVGAALDSTLLVLTTDGKRIAAHDFETKISDLAFSPTDERIAVALTNGQAFFFDIVEKAVQSLPGASAKELVFDPKGERLMTSDYDMGFSQIRDARTGETLHGPLKAELSYRGAFSPDGAVVVVCGWTGAIPFQVSTGELAGDTLWNDDAVAFAAFSPDYKLLATANYDGTVRLWNARNFRALTINHILEHESRPERIAFIDETTLVTHCNDGENYVWNLGTKPPEPALIPRLERPDRLNIQAKDAALTAEGRFVRGKVGGINVDVELPDTVSVLALNPRHDSFAAGSKDPRFENTYALLFRVSDLSNPVRLSHKDGINHLAFSHSGEKVVTCSEDFSAIIWAARSGKRLTQPMRHTWQVTYAAFSSDDRWLVTAGSDRVCIIWSADNGEPLTPPLSFPGQLQYVDFEPDGQGIVAGTKAGDYRMDLPFAELPLKEQSKYLQNWIEPTIITRF
jgi:WD40 repeat protein